METSFHFSLAWAIVIVAVLFAALLVPYLIKEIGQGKKQLTPKTPPGAGDARPGRPDNPAPGLPDGQADPYGPQAHANRASR